MMPNGDIPNDNAVPMSASVVPSCLAVSVRHRGTLVVNPLCSATIYSAWGSVNCSRRGKIQRGKEWYCTQHDPEFIAEKKRKREKRWAEEDAEFNRKLANEKRIEEIATWVLKTRDKHLATVVEMAERILGH